MLATPAVDVKSLPQSAPAPAGGQYPESGTAASQPKTFIPYKRFFGKANGGQSLFIPLVIARCPWLGFAAKMLYGRLCFHAGPDGECFPSEETLAYELGLVNQNGEVGESQIRTLRNYLKELKDGQLIQVQARYNARGERTSNAYRFLDHEMFKITHIHRKNFSGGDRKNISAKVRKESSGKDRNKFSGIKEEPERKEQSSSKRRTFGKEERCEPDLQNAPVTPRVAPEPEKQTPSLSSKNDDDKPRYASPHDRLIALMAQDLGRQPEMKLVRDVHDEVTRKGATLVAFCDDIDPRLKRLKSRPGGHPGFFLEHARQFANYAPRPAPTAMPLSEIPSPLETKDPAAWRAGMCPGCGGGGCLQKDPPIYCPDCQIGRELDRIAKRAPSKEVGQEVGPAPLAEAVGI